jgi:hypothetical protein
MTKNARSLDSARDDRVVWDRGWGSFEVRFCRSASLFPAGPGSFSGLTQDFVRTGVLDFVLGCFFRPFGLGFGGGGVGVTCVSCERLDVAWLASANARSLGFARDDRVSDERWGRSI